MRILLMYTLLISSSFLYSQTPEIPTTPDISDISGIWLDDEWSDVQFGENRAGESEGVLVASPHEPAPSLATRAQEYVHRKVSQSLLFVLIAWHEARAYVNRLIPFGSEHE